MMISMVAPGILSTLQDQRDIASSLSVNKAADQGTGSAHQNKTGSDGNSHGQNSTSSSTSHPAATVDKYKNASDTHPWNEGNETDRNATSREHGSGNDNQSARNDSDTNQSSSPSVTNGSSSITPDRPIGPQYYNLVVCTTPDISLKPVSPIAYQSFEVHFRVQNTGSGYLSSVTFDNYVYIDGIHKASVSFSGSLSSGAKTGDLYVTIAAELSAGSHTIKIFTDATNKVTELAANAESDNTRTITITIGARPLPDLIVNDISVKDCDGKNIKLDTSYNAFPVTSGQPFTVTVEIQNIGSADAKGTIAVILTVQISSSPGDQIKAKFSQMDLKKNGKASWTSTTLSYNFLGLTKLYSTHAISVSVDTANAITESNEGNNAKSQSIRIVKAEWTIMVYMSSGASAPSPSPPLDTTISHTLNQLRSVGSSASVNIIALYDPTGFGNDKAFFIQKGTTSEIALSAIDSSWSTEVDMGLGQTLMSFGNYAISRFKANHYFLGLEDHGGGLLSNAIWDDSTRNSMTIPEIRSSLLVLKDSIRNVNPGSRGLDIVTFDCCDMGFMELAYEIRDCANIMIASQTEIPSLLLINDQGFLYWDTPLSGLKSNPLMTGRDLAISFVDAFVNWWANLIYMIPATFYVIWGQSVQLAAIDLTQIDILANDISGLAYTLISLLPNARNAIDKSISETLSLISGLDLYQFAEKISNEVNDGAVKTWARNIQLALSNQVIIKSREFSDPFKNSLADCHGLSINIYKMDSFNNIPPLRNTLCPDFDSASYWDEFLVALYDTMPPEAPVDITGILGWSSETTRTFSWAVSDLPFSESYSCSGICDSIWRIDNGPETGTGLTHVTVPSLPDGIHVFSVRAVDNANNLGSSSTFTFKVDATPPTRPGNPTFSPTDALDGIFTLSWIQATDTTSGIYGYELQQMVSGGSWVTVDENIAGSLNFYTVSVLPGTYYFRVRAIDFAANIGPYSGMSAPAVVPGYWFGMTIDDNHFFNFYSFQDSSHGTAYHIDTIGSSDWAYQFMGTYTEKFVVRSDGTIGVSGWFRFSDLGFQPPEYPPEGRRLVYLYLIVMDPVSNTIEGTVLVLGYTDPVDTWIWVDNLVVSGLIPGSTINIGIGRSDAWEIDWELTAEWAGVVVSDANGLHAT